MLRSALCLRSLEHSLPVQLQSMKAIHVLQPKIESDCGMQPEGNKMFKLQFFIDLFHHNRQQRHDMSLVSVGSAQSNAMLSMFQMVHLVNKLGLDYRMSLTYYTPPLPRSMRAAQSKSIRGNWQRVQEVIRDNASCGGMKVVECASKDEYMKQKNDVDHGAKTQWQQWQRDFPEYRDVDRPLYEFLDPREVLIPDGPIYIRQGCGQSEASYGMYQLSEMIVSKVLTFLQNTGREDDNVILVIPAGTASTSTFIMDSILSRPECSRFQIWTCPVVLRSRTALLHEIRSTLLSTDENDALFTSQLARYEAIINSGRLLVIPEQGRLPQFASLHSEHLDMYNHFCDHHQIEFDLNYAPRTLLQAGEKLQSCLDSGSLHPDSTSVFYLHTGGIAGNETMISRYSRQQALRHKS